MREKLAKKIFSEKLENERNKIKKLPKIKQDRKAEQNKNKKCYTI